MISIGIGRKENLNGNTRRLQLSASGSDLLIEFISKQEVTVRTNATMLVYKYKYFPIPYYSSENREATQREATNLRTAEMR